MTTPEHTLVGIHFAFALGIQRWVGWRGIAMAGVASNLPDWDGLPMLIDMQRFESGHRVWGHGLLPIFLMSLLIGFSQIRWDWIGRIARRMRKLSPQTQSTEIPQNPSWVTGVVGFCVFSSIGLFVQLLHLPCDMVVSGGNGLSDWAIQPLWPFSDAPFVYPLIPWGDVGPTVILMAGILVIAKRSQQLSLTAWLTIIALCGYLIARGWTRGALVI